ncbi:MAG: hypothetical protein EA374_08015 [Acholeplasmatales bacterium]|nr:MAG: hypothetical protein EA374_08015 [Acholeplasmatales bacterium]
MKHRLILPVSAMLFVLMTTLFVVVAFLLNQGTLETASTIGDVSVSGRVFFEQGGFETDAEEVVIDLVSDTRKPGVYTVNVIDVNALQFIENLRVELFVESDVDTYIRVSLVDSLTLLITNFEGVQTEIPIIGDPFDFNVTSDWVDRVSVDGFYYLQNPVQRLDASTPLVIPLIEEYFPGLSFSPLPIGYSLQIALRIEAVQAIEGPQRRWGLPTPPWGGTW